MAEPKLKPEQVARETIRPHLVAQIAPGQCGSLERWLGVGSGFGWALLGSVLGSLLWYGNHRTPSLTEVGVSGCRLHPWEERPIMCGGIGTDLRVELSRRKENE